MLSVTSGTEVVASVVELETVVSVWFSSVGSVGLVTCSVVLSVTSGTEVVASAVELEMVVSG